MSIETDISSAKARFVKKQYKEERKLVLLISSFHYSALCTISVTFKITIREHFRITHKP